MALTELRYNSRTALSVALSKPRTAGSQSSRSSCSPAGEGCVEKPVSTLWRNYVSSSRPDVSMRLTVTSGGLTATTKDHGLTEYWAHRVTYCTAPASHPRLFVWVYRHEGRRLRPELRCHAALCSKESTARRLASILNTRLQQALLEFRRDKVSRQNAR